LEQLNILIRIGAFRFTGQTKRQLLWEACLLYKHKLPDRGMKALFTQPVKKFEFPPMVQSYREDALEEIELLGFPLCSRFDLLTQNSVAEIKARDMINNEGKTVSMAGYLTNSKYTRTSKGDYMQFGSFVDDEGQTFEAVLFPNVFRKYFMSYKAIYALKGRIKLEYDVPILELEKCMALEVSFSRDHTGTLMMPDAVEAGQHKQLIRLKA
jgi:DNA polymerase-3 subunit alpha